ncbi:aminotransferase class V-fold PLP-dependent enzyme [Microbacterium sp.]|uniref:kynureninase n=1 Tax=Microbacterium sp. TaxID=51671 RepID=UPI00262FCCE7|nr:aminotransferase class V-fold PLP-dependent enzyme [Microbacterium sp.]
MTDPHPTADPATLTARARDLDDADPLGAFVDEFVPSGEVVSYLDGNSLGRPLRALPDLVTAFIEKDWGSGLIRSWDAGWMQRPVALGDRLGRIALGATAGQVFIGDSTTVLLYKAVRAAVAARPERTEIVIDDDNFPTDRYIVEGIAAETGRTVRWIHADPASGVTADQVREAVNDQTAAVLLSHVAYRSGWVADVPGITDIIHSAGAIAIWDLCHSAGVIPTELDAWDVDLAVGCTYKYLNGGPGSPAFGYVRTELQSRLQQPIQGWMGTADVFEMGPSYRPALGIRRFVSGTPAIFAMLAMDAMLDLIERAGIDAVYAKSIRLTDFAEQSLGVHVLPHGARLESPQRGAHRGSHLTVAHPAFRDLTPVLWEQGVIPDFRAPDGIRIGLSPLSTTFAEVDEGIRILAEELARAAAAQK